MAYRHTLRWTITILKARPYLWITITPELLSSGCLDPGTLWQSRCWGAPWLCLVSERWQCGRQGKHEVDSWMYTAIFTACAAYSSPELRMVMSQAYQSMESQWQDLQSGNRLTGPGKSRGGDREISWQRR